MPLKATPSFSDASSVAFANFLEGDFPVTSLYHVTLLHENGPENPLATEWCTKRDMRDKVILVNVFIFGIDASSLARTSDRVEGNNAITLLHKRS